jgi:hypothetical protein
VQETVREGLPCRYVLAILAFWGFVFNYALRININIALVAMVNHSAINHGDGAEAHARECGRFVAPVLTLLQQHSSSDGSLINVTSDYSSSTIADEKQDDDHPLVSPAAVSPNPLPRTVQASSVLSFPCSSRTWQVKNVFFVFLRCPLVR